MVRTFDTSKTFTHKIGTEWQTFTAGRHYLDDKFVTVFLEICAFRGIDVVEVFPGEANADFLLKKGRAPRKKKSVASEEPSPLDNQGVDGSEEELPE